MQSPAVGVVWEKFVFRQLRDRERGAGRTGSLFFWRDRICDVDFLIDASGILEPLEARWTKLPTDRDAVNLEFVRRAVSKSRVVGAAVVSRTHHNCRLAGGFRAVPVTELG